MNLSIPLFFAALLILTGCGTPTPAVQSSAKPDFDPTSYQTFAIIEPEPNPLAPGAPALYRTAKMVMVSSLRAKGLSEGDLETADLVFQASGGTIPMTNASQYGFLYAGDGWMWYPVSYRTNNMNSQSSGVIVVNAFDNASKELAWQAMSRNNTNTGAAASQSAMDSLKAIMAQYPGQ